MEWIICGDEKSEDYKQVNIVYIFKMKKKFQNYRQERFKVSSGNILQNGLWNVFSKNDYE